MDSSRKGFGTKHRKQDHHLVALGHGGDVEVLEEVPMLLEQCPLDVVQIPLELYELEPASEAAPAGCTGVSPVVEGLYGEGAHATAIPEFPVVLLQLLPSRPLRNERLQDLLGLELISDAASRRERPFPSLEHLEGVGHFPLCATQSQDAWVFVRKIRWLPM